MKHLLTASVLLSFVVVPTPGLAMGDDPGAVSEVRRSWCEAPCPSGPGYRKLDERGADLRRAALQPPNSDQ